MAGQQIVQINEWEQPSEYHHRWEAEIYPFNYEVIARADTYEQLLKNLATKKVQKQIERVRIYANDRDSA